MARSEARHLKADGQKKVVKLFNEACYRWSRWEVWSDFVTMVAISISNTVDLVHAKEREATYLNLAKKYNTHEFEIFARMFAEITMGIDEDPEQDFLGELFMCLELGNSYNGQFFTPYSVCQMMAAISNPDAKSRIEKQGWITVNDCACGAGALLVAFANDCRRKEINYQTTVLFTAQDIDMVAGMMCYIQLSLLGCPGYVTIANTITHPTTSIDPRGLIPTPGQNVWYTPMYFRDVWEWRRKWFMASSLFGNDEKKPEPHEEPIPEAPGAQTPKYSEIETGQLTLF